MKHLFKLYAAFAVVAILALSATSCVDDTFISSKQKQNTITLDAEAFTSIAVDLNATVQAPNIVQEGSGKRAPHASCRKTRTSNAAYAANRKNIILLQYNKINASYTMGMKQFVA